MNEERESIRLLVSQSLMALCRSQLDYKQELSVDALVAITIDRKEVVVINVKEFIDFNSPPSVTGNFCYSPQPHNNFSSPIRNESASDLDETILKDHFVSNHESMNQIDDLQKKEDYKDKYDDTKPMQTNITQHYENPHTAVLTVIAPSNSFHNDDEDLLHLNHLEEVIDNSTHDQNASLKTSAQVAKEKTLFPRISLKSFSPSHIKNKIRLNLNKPNKIVNHETSLSNGAQNKNIILNSSLTPPQIINMDASNNTLINSNLTQLSKDCNNKTPLFSRMNHKSPNPNHNSTNSSALVFNSNHHKVLSVATDDKHKGNMAWDDFQNMLIKSLRRNHQDELDVKPELMQYIQSWTETEDSNSHSRLSGCMQAILLYEGRYVPVRDIQRLRLSGMTSQEIRSSMEFLNSTREGRVGCYREIRGCIGVFYKCPPHLVDAHWLSLFGLSHEVYALKFASRMPLNATNRHSAAYWDRIHSSSPYINASHPTS